MSGDRRQDGAGLGRFARIRASQPVLPFLRRSSDDAPRVAFTRADAARLNERFALLDRSERRAIVRAVNRGEGMEKRRDAELAIGVARRQQRFWTRAWLLGPAIAIVQVLFIPTVTWREGLLLAAWGSLLLGLMAAWWWTRARRSEMLNLQVIGPRGSGGRSRDAGRTASGGAGRGTEGGTRRRSRLPGGRPSGLPTSPLGGDDTTEHEAGAREHGVARPPRPRGRKRR